MWERRYGAEPSPAWQSALGHLSLEDLALGVRRCERDDSGRVPTPGQFAALCRTYSPAVERVVRGPWPTLPQITGRTITGRIWLAFLRLEGLAPLDGATADDLDAALDGHDIDAMRARHHEARAELERRYVQPHRGDDHA